jgi:hypothetical protein
MLAQKLVEERGELLVRKKPKKAGHQGNYKKQKQLKQRGTGGSKNAGAGR